MNRDFDPPALRSVAIFNFSTKVRTPADFVEAIARVSDLIVPHFERHGLAPGGTKIHETGVSQVVFVEERAFVVTIACQESNRYEWALSVDALPPLYHRLFDLPPKPLDDSTQARTLLRVLDSALRADPSFSDVSWHKKETLSPRDLSSQATAPF
jgi:hypothetical protein